MLTRLLCICATVASLAPTTSAAAPVESGHLTHRVSTLEAGSETSVDSTRVTVELRLSIRDEDGAQADITLPHEWLAEHGLRRPGDRLALSLDEIGMSAAAGRVIPRLEPATTPCGAAGRTQFAYFADGTLLTTIDPEGNRTARGLDGLGRVRWEQDPDRGLTTYDYDGYGRLSILTDAAGESQHLHYEVAAGGTVGYHVYDTLSRETERWQRVDGAWDELRIGYDENGRIGSVTYPTRSTATAFGVTHDYDLVGRQIAASRTDTHAKLWELPSSAGRRALDAWGHATREEFGNGVSTERGYDVRTGMLTSLQTFAAHPGPNPQLLQDLEYTYDTNRNLIRRNDRLHSDDRDFEYDALEHLRFERRDGGTLREYRYDSLGNMSWSSDVGALTHGMPGGPGAAPHLVHAVLESSDGQYKYDDAGRMVAGPGGRVITWNGLGLPASIGDADSLEELRYDAYGRRVSSRVGGVDTVRMDGLYERRSKLGEEDVEIYHVIAGGHEVARVERREGGSERVASFHSDEMGSLALLVGHSGEVLARRAYEPFGGRREEPWTRTSGALGSEPTTGFTGHRHDDSVGLIDMNARLYDPHLRHFISPDPIIANVNAPAAYNAYAYVLQNPFKWTDPSGMDNVPVSGTERVPSGTGDVFVLPELHVFGASTDEGPATPPNGAEGADSGLSPNVNAPAPIIMTNGDERVADAHIDTIGPQIPFLTRGTRAQRRQLRDIGFAASGNQGNLRGGGFGDIAVGGLNRVVDFALAVGPVAQALHPGGAATLLSAPSPMPPRTDIAGFAEDVGIDIGVDRYSIEYAHFTHGVSLPDALLMAVGGAFTRVGAARGAITGFNAAESAIIHEARGIVNAAEFAELRAAHVAGQSATVRIGGRLIQYEPGLPASGMTMLGENGFLIGREAFASQAELGELGKTVLHELYRLGTSASASGVSGSVAASETAAAFGFAE